jgi:hypothetical protein
VLPRSNVAGDVRGEANVHVAGDAADTAATVRDLDVNGLGGTAAHSEIDDEESTWKQRCEDAGVQYIPKGAPGYTDELQTHKAKQKAAKAAKTKRRGAMSKRIAAASRTVTASGSMDVDIHSAQLAAPPPFADVVMRD